MPPLREKLIICATRPRIEDNNNVNKVLNRFFLVLVALVAISTADPALAEEGGDFGDTAFLGYEGDQNWPAGDNAQVLSDFAVPIYIGLPTKRYQVLGRIIDPRGSGIGVMTRAFSEGLFSEKDR
jgi:hypothetical protein